MANQLTLSGGFTGAPAGAATIGPSTVTGTKAQPEIVNVELEAAVEKKVAVPPEAGQWAVMFQFVSGTPPTVTIKTNVAGDGVMSVPALGYVSAGIVGACTELAFKAVSAPKVFQLVFV